MSVEAQPGDLAPTAGITILLTGRRRSGRRRVDHHRRQLKVHSAQFQLSTIQLRSQLTIHKIVNSPGKQRSKDQRNRWLWRCEGAMDVIPYQVSQVVESGEDCQEQI